MKWNSDFVESQHHAYHEEKPPLRHNWRNALEPIKY